MHCHGCIHRVVRVFYFLWRIVEGWWIKLCWNDIMFVFLYRSNCWLVSEAKGETLSTLLPSFVRLYRWVEWHIRVFPEWYGRSDKQTNWSKMLFTHLSHPPLLVLEQHLLMLMLSSLLITLITKSSTKSILLRQANNVTYSCIEQ